MNKIFNKKIVVFLIIGILIFLGIYFLTRGKKEEKIFVKDFQYITTTKSNLVGSILLDGKVFANNPIGIFVDKKLKVNEVEVKNGDYVEKNQLLVTFDDEEKNKIERAITKERINFKKIQRNLKATEELYDIGGASLEEVLNLRDNLKISKLNLEELEELQNKTVKEIKSPVAGVISNLKAQKNYLVDTDSSLMDIIDLDDLKIIVEIPEYNSSMIRNGDEVAIKLEATGDEKFYKGKIKKISKLSMISSLTSENILEAEVKLDKKIPNLIPGFKIKARIDLKNDEAKIIIPKISLLFENNKYYVFLLVGENEIKKQEIQIENIAGENIVVLSGLKENDRVVRVPDKRLKNGLILTKGE